MYDFGEGKGQGSNDMEKYEWKLAENECILILSTSAKL